MKCCRWVASVLLAIFFVHSLAFAQTASSPARKTRWVDSIYQSLTLEERIGQLFMVAAYSGGPKYNETLIRTLLENHQIGGVIFMQGTAEAQAVQTNAYQAMAQVPLLIGMDAEWGLGMRLSGVRDFPRQMMIGASRDTNMAYAMGGAIARQCKRLGVHIDFAPVVDINNNPNNPVINARSFGENKKLVARLGIAYMKGLQDNGVMACAKHFPGHGDTDADSHKDLPVIPKTLAMLDTLEFYPFKALIKAGVQSAMVAHLEVPSLEPTPGVPSTVSYNVVTGVLRERLKFKGLVFTDALNMQGVAKYYQPGEVDLKAFMAGNDVLLFSQDVPTAIQKIRTAIDSGLVTEARLEASVRKILGAKWDAGLYQPRFIDSTSATADLNKDVNSVRERTVNRAITLLRDKHRLLGKITASDARVSYIGVNGDSTYLFRALQARMPTLRYDRLRKGGTGQDLKRILDGMPGNDVTLVAVHNLSFYPSAGGSHGLDATQVALLQACDTLPNVMVVNFGNAYLNRFFCQASAVLQVYEDDSISQMAAYKVLTRQMTARGVMPVTPVCNDSLTPAPAIVETKPPALPEELPAYTLQRMAYPEDAGVKKPDALKQLNQFIQKAIVEGAFPGCRILAARNGKVFFDEAYGYYDYTRQQEVTLNTLYDIASVTKVAATTLAVMKLYETGRINLDKTLGDYLPMTQGTDKAGLKIRDLLLHQAGLKSWIPFYKETLDADKQLREDVYATRESIRYPIPVAKGLYIRKDYPDTMWQRILDSPLENTGKYVYSDLDFYFLAAVVESITERPLDEYLAARFYKPMGLKRMTYTPLEHGFAPEDIAPTENDLSFRKQTIHGYVHDPGAAMLGGVAGHAGLFASARDLAVVFQMLLNGGVYEGKRYLKQETVRYFAGYNSALSRRGLGFDKPSADVEDGGPAGNRVSGYAFGHQGFTGTCAWADPATGIVFIFLSNRVHPSADNNNLNRLSVRTVTQDLIYESLGVDVDRSRKKLWEQEASRKRP